MKITVTFNMFCDMMEEEYPDALHLLFDWLEMFEDTVVYQDF